MHNTYIAIYFINRFTIKFIGIIIAFKINICWDVHVGTTELIDFNYNLKLI